MEDNEFANAARSVSYEAKHLWFAFDAYNRFKGSPTEPNLATLAFEAFLVHYRNLREFLAEPAEQDDMEAAQFVPQWKRPAWPDHLSHPRRMDDPRYSERKQIDKRLVHLTHFREEIRDVTKPSAEWPISAMFRTARDNFLSFVSQVDGRYRDSFQEAVALLRATIVTGLEHSAATTATVESSRVFG